MSAILNPIFEPCTYTLGTRKLYCELALVSIGLEKTTRTAAKIDGSSSREGGRGPAGTEHAYSAFYPQIGNLPFLAVNPASVLTLPSPVIFVPGIFLQVR